jgi:peptidoglycan/xylan/chitin deacetylase (PgdA/CDA1 family)
MRLVTTSWDDGHPLDRRVAGLLEAHGLRGTFYVPRENPERAVMSPADMRQLAACGNEIGAHTLTHCDLTRVGQDRSEAEVGGSKEWLEDWLGQRVVSFCYPRGRHDRGVRSMVRDAGFALGRTTLPLHTDVGSDPFRLPVTLQVYPHTKAEYVRHAARYGDVTGIAAILRERERDFLPMLASLTGRLAADGGTIHLWGHSWEIDALGWWGVLEDALKLLADVPGAEFVTNGELCARGHQ